MKTNYNTYRQLLLQRRYRSIRQFFGQQAPLQLMADILDISTGKCHYLLRHPEQIHPGYLEKLDGYFDVPGDTFWDLCAYQWKRDHERYRLKEWSVEFWCLRKIKVRHR